jgi:hypothetical protein
VYVAGILDGFLYRVDATSGAVIQSGKLDHAISLGGPIVDSTQGLVYAFAARDGGTACSGGPCAGVFQLPANFAATTTGTEAIVGLASPAGPLKPLYDGGFDNEYLTSLTTRTGNLYVCGNVGAEPTFYQVPIQAGVIKPGVAIGVLAATGSNPECSPLADVSDPGATLSSAATERVFVGVQGNSIICPGGGCVQSLIDTPWQASKTFAVGQEILVQGPSPLVRFIEVVTTAGTSGSTEPTWTTPFGDIFSGDGGVTWINQGNPALTIHPWEIAHGYSLTDTRILDSNGNVQIVTIAGTSGGAAPTWATTPGAPTVDGTVTWINAGAFPMIGLASGGGSSGIIIDTLGSVGLAGTSQIYFTTQGNQCGSGGLDGCAVQASRTGLN